MAGEQRTVEGVVEKLVGRVAEALEDQAVTNVVRRKLLKVAEGRLEMLEAFLEDESVDKEKRVRALMKALEIGIRVPGAAMEAESESLTIRVRTGGVG